MVRRCLPLPRREQPAAGGTRGEPIAYLAGRDVRGGRVDLRRARARAHVRALTAPRRDAAERSRRAGVGERRRFVARRRLSPRAHLGQSPRVTGARPTFGIYLPQVGFGFAEILERALLCEELGFDALWLMDHLYPPELPDVPSFEAWTLATALLARTTRLRVGHLVLSATFRHPALLAKMATSLDVIADGRLELGIGSGSYQPEHERAGLAWGSARERALLLEETLEIVTRAFASARCDFVGERFVVRDLPNVPQPAQRPRPPIHVGGAGARFTLPLVARFADVWNCPTYALAHADAKRATVLEACS
ncbi:LLM class flavin-dependent oxidoreductase, partial [Candidatus Binatia bacterium]|nr:LLM class flavin-dependent oxidoreductase [Candidatus Binatia bacterium]